jgi:signal transduction histidine kinase
MSGGVIEVTLYESHLRAAMLRFGVNILILSLILSGIVAGLVFAALHAVLLRPIKRLTRNMVSFRENPEDRSRIIAPSVRRDEIGMAERELHAMQSELSATLQQKTRLAALGLAVSKVSHDLRNMLSSAQLISDRLAMAEDPTVKRFAPKLIASLDRAISFLSQTLRFGRADEPPPAREVFRLKDLADEVIDTEVLQASDRIVLFNQIPADLDVDADRDQMMRILTNLIRNAVQALDARPAGDGEAADGRVTLKARRDGSVAVIEISDNGPGIPEQVRPRLFEAFRWRGPWPRHRRGTCPRPWRRDPAVGNQRQWHHLHHPLAGPGHGTPPRPAGRQAAGARCLTRAPQSMSIAGATKPWGRFASGAGPEHRSRRPLEHSTQEAVKPRSRPPAKGRRTQDQ